MVLRVYCGIFHLDKRFHTRCFKKFCWCFLRQLFLFISLFFFFFSKKKSLFFFLEKVKAYFILEKITLIFSEVFFKLLKYHLVFKKHSPSFNFTLLNNSLKTVRIQKNTYFVINLSKICLNTFIKIYKI